MEKTNELSIQELLDAYSKVNDFLKYLDLEEKNIEE